MKRAIYILALIGCYSQAQATLFIDAHLHLREFADYKGSPYDFDSPPDWFSPRFVPIQCDAIAQQSERVRSYSEELQQNNAMKATALKNHDEVAFKELKVTGEELNLQFIAASGYLRVLQSRPIRGIRALHPSDPIADFLVDVSLSKLKEQSWAESVKLLRLKSSLPVRTWRPDVMLLFDDSVYVSDFVDASFSKLEVPDLGAWRASVGRKRANPPIELSIGWKATWDYCMPPAKGDGKIECLNKDIALNLDLTHGQFCAASEENRGAILSVEVEHTSPMFDQQVVSTVFRVGGGRVETTEEETARIEGHNAALDHLFQDFIRDIFGTAQMYRVNDSILSRYDGGAHDEGSTLIYKNFEGRRVEVASLSIRDALNLLNGELQDESGPPSETSLTKALALQDRYRGKWVTTKDGVKSIIEFHYKPKGKAARIGFFSTRYDVGSHSDGIVVAYIVFDDVPLYLHRSFYCTGGSIGCW